MKNTFSDYEHDYDYIWENCIFVFDTNVLLDLYSYSEKTTEDFLNSLEDDRICNRIWLPYQVSVEYHMNCSSIISKEDEIYDKLTSGIKNNIKALKKEFEDFKNSFQTEHRYLDLDNVYHQYENEINEFEDQMKLLIEKIELEKSNNPQFSDNDPIRDRLYNLFDGKVGKNYDHHYITKNL